MAAILFDLDGVLYQGGEAVPGAAEAVRWFADRGVPRLFLTNTTSRDRTGLVEKLAGYGIETSPEQYLTPPVAATAWLRRHVHGPVALFVPEATRREFDAVDTAPPEAESAAAVVVGDLGEGWDFATLNRAFRLLMSAPPPALVALGLTRYWRAPDGLRLDVGAFTAALQYASGVEPVVLGKPSGDFFQAALARLDATASQTVIIGDDIRGDVGAAQACGLTAIQVRTGKFTPGDLAQGIEPDAVLDSVADLPEWWRRRFGGAG